MPWYERWLYKLLVPFTRSALLKQKEEFRWLDHYGRRPWGRGRIDRHLEGGLAGGREAPGGGQRDAAGGRVLGRAGGHARREASARGQVEVQLEAAQRAVAPGQAAVFYDGDVLLGGGWID